MAEHGTRTRYMQHCREEGAGKDCPPCLAAHNRYMRAYYAQMTPYQRDQLRRKRSQYRQAERMAAKWAALVDRPDMRKLRRMALAEIRAREIDDE